MRLGKIQVLIMGRLRQGARTKKWNRERQEAKPGSEGSDSVKMTMSLYKVIFRVEKVCEKEGEGMSWGGRDRLIERERERERDLYEFCYLKIQGNPTIV